MGHFVEQHEQHVAGHEFREPLDIFRRCALESRIGLAERQGGRVDPRLKCFGRRRLGDNRRRIGHQSDKQNESAPGPRKHTKVWQGWYLRAGGSGDLSLLLGLIDASWSSYSTSTVPRMA